ncbi:MAG TPA: NnrU family protein, partial [Steroidobacteraceae bacterium]|nr:NnrU family protein [Steroidobacteraceae bacterium]
TRDSLVRLVGLRVYFALFIVATLGIIVWMFLAYEDARAEGVRHFWSVTPATRGIQLGLMLIAALFIEAGISTGRNPGLVFMEKTMNDANVVQGVLRVTRHPFLWGWAVLAAGHMLVNGDEASLVAFGASLITAVFGTYSIDAKRRRVYGDNWLAYERQTSNIPFAAILDGRQLFKPAEIGWRFSLGVIAWAGLLFLHPYFFGVAALP